MDSKIVFDFKLSRKVSDTLEEIAECINTNIVAKSEADQVLFSRALECDSTNDFLNKYRTIISRYDVLKNRLIIQSENLNVISRHMFLIEEETKKLAVEDKY